MVREVKCNHCYYKWLTNHRRPDPRFITCPNCRGNVELRAPKLKEMRNIEED